VKDATGDAVPVNWAHAFSAVLEKRGYVDYQIWDIDDLGVGALASDQPGLLFVGPCRDGGLTPDDLHRIRAIACPTFIESRALGAAARSALQVVASGSNECHRMLQAGEGRLADVMGVFTPLLERVSAAGREFLLPNGRVQTRYEMPAPGTFRAQPEDTTEMLGAKAAAKLAFSLCRRARESANALPFPSDAVSFMAACGLALIAVRFPANADRTFVRGAANSIFEALAKLDFPGSADLHARCSAASTAGTVCASDADCIASIRELPLISSVFAMPSAIQGVEDKPTQEVAGCAIRRVVEANDPSLCSWLVNARLDREKMAFFQPCPDATGAQQRRYANHPVLLVALALAGFPLGSCLPASLDAVSAGISETQIERWRASTGWHGDTTASARVAAAAMLHYADSLEPAAWRHDGLDVLGFPALALLGHAHTLPPLSEPFLWSDAHRALILEELLFGVVEERLLASRRAVARIAPWPDGGAAPLVVRHDVDRHPSDEQFDALLASYARRGLRASWYWIADRLRPSRMRRLAAAGHEVGLHAMYGLDKADELEAIAAVVERPRGECHHGAGAEYHRGAYSVLAAASAGLAYTEMHPCCYGFPYARFPWVAADGSLSYEERLVHVTFNVTTDGMDGQSRKTDYTTSADFVLATRDLGHYVCMLNHPDINAEPLDRFLGRAEVSELVPMTAAELACWWRATHVRGSFGVVGEGERLIVDARALPPHAVVELLTGEAPGAVMWRDAGGDREVRPLPPAGGEGSAEARGTWRVQGPGQPV